VVGADNAVGQLDRIKKAANDVGTAATVLTREQDALTKGMASAATARNGEISGLAQQAKQAESVTASITALGRVHQQYLSTIDQAKSLRAAGLLTEVEYKAAVDAAASSLAFNAAQALKSGVAMRETADAAEKASVDVGKFEKVLIGAGGQAGLVVAQLRLLKDTAAAALELIARNPVLAGAAAVTVLIGAAVVASESYQARVNDLIVAERTHGNSLGLERQGYVDLAAAIAVAANVSDREGLKITGALVGRNSSVDEMKTAAAAVRDYARATGQELPAAAAAMAQAIDDPIGTLKRLEEAGLGVDRATQQTIKDLIEQGRTQDAGALTAQQLAKAYAGIADNVTRSGDAWDRAKVAMQDFFDGAANTITSLPAEVKRVLWGGTPGPADTSEADRVKAQQSARARTDAGNFVGGIIDQLDPYGSQLRTLGNQRKGVIEQTNTAITNGADKTKALADQTRALNLIDTESARVKKAQRDAALSLNEELKARLEREKSLIAGGPQAIAAAKAQADAQVQLAGHVLDGVGAQQKFNDQVELDKTILPYSTALVTARGKAAKELAQIIDALTASIQKGQVAQHAADSANDVQSQFAGMSGQFLSEADRDQQLKDSVKNLEQWRDTVVGNLKAGRDAGDITSAAFDKLAAKAQDVFEYQLSNLYLADTQKRKDWASGIALGLNQVEQDTADWANTSKNLITSGADALKSGFFDMILNQRDPLQSFFSWFEQSLAQMVWQSKLAGPANSIVGGLTNLLGKAFGLGDIGYNPGSGAIDAPMAVDGVPIAHAGWEVGRSAAPGYRRVPANDNGWARAPRLHTGTGSQTVGDYLAAGEHRVIVKDSERVVTDQQWKDRAGGVSVYDAAPKISFSFNNQSGVALQGRQGQTKRTADGYSFEIIVSKMQEKIAEDIHNGSSAVSAAFEQHYALQRRPGG
jgi:hypothetical protein